MRTWRTVLIGASLAFLLLAAPAPVCAGEARRAAERAFLRDRDPERLHAALAAAGEASAGPVLALLDLARGRPRSDAWPPAEARGFDALPEVTWALHRLDLAWARRAATRADTGDGGMAAAWASALVRVRRGDDSGGVGRLLAPPLFNWDRDAFSLALFGAALPEADRLMLAAAGREALRRAARRGRVAALSRTALALAALDPRRGRAAFVLAVRALRRHGDLAEARRLLAMAADAGVPRDHPPLALESALTAWRGGQPEQVGTLLAGLSPPAGLQAAFLALRRAKRRPRVLATGGGVRQATGEAAHLQLIARLATALGKVTSPEEVERFAQEHAADVAPQAGLARRFLEARGFVVLSVAGDSGAGDAALAAGYPFLLMRITRAGVRYEDAPVLVHGHDRRTNLWLLDEPAMERLDVLPRTHAVKARLLVAVPGERRAVVEPLSGTPAAALGRALEDALDRAARGDAAAAIARLEGSGSGACAALYRAFVLHGEASKTREETTLERARQALEASRRTAPLLGFEDYVRGQALVVAGKQREGLAAFQRVQRVEGPSETVALARFVALSALRERAAARAALDEALYLAPLDGRALVYRGVARVGAGEIEAGRADLRRALDRRPGSVKVAVALATLELEGGRPAAALDILRETVRRDPALESNPVLRTRWRMAELAVIQAAASVKDLEALRRSPEADTRRRLAFALAGREREGDAAEGLLRELLGDEDEGVRVSTLRLYMRPWLRRRVASDAVLCRRVCRMVSQEKEPTVRAAAATLLGRIEASFGCRALAAAVAGETADPDASVRSAAARALGARGGKPAAAALVEALTDADLTVRKMAIDALFRQAATTHGYEAAGEPAARTAAIARWRAWLETER